MAEPTAIEALCEDEGLFWAFFFDFYERAEYVFCPLKQGSNLAHELLRFTSFFPLWVYRLFD